MACRQKQPCATDRICERNWHACPVGSRVTVIPTGADLIHHVYHWRCTDCEATWTLSQNGKWYRDPR